MSFVSNELGAFLYGKGLYMEAEPLIGMSLKLDEQLSGVNSVNAAMKLSNMGMLLKVTGRLHDAEPLLRRAIEIFFASEEQSPNRTVPLNILALVLMEKQQYVEAEGLLQRALTLADEAGDQPSIAVAFHNLALLLKSTGRAVEAESVIRRSLEVSQRFYGEGHPRTARKMQILAGILRDLGRLDEAEPLARQALEIFESILGPDHPQTQSAQHDLDTLTAA
jgi:tetratricopeptide (TPR) repeat protein